MIAGVSSVASCAAPIPERLLSNHGGNDEGTTTKEVASSYRADCDARSNSVAACVRRPEESERQLNHHSDQAPYRADRREPNLRQYLRDLPAQAWPDRF